MNEPTPNLVISGLSGLVTQDEITVEVNIVRLESEAAWSLEVVNGNGTSIVWDDQFSSDAQAIASFWKVVEEEGMATFLDGANVIPFPKR